MNRPLRLALAGVAVLALAAAGCGDDGSQSDRSEDTIDTRPDTGANETTAASATADASNTSGPASPTSASPATSATTPDTTPDTTADPTPDSAPDTTAGSVPGPTTPPSPCGSFDPVPGSAVISGTVPLDWDGDGSQEAAATVYETSAGTGDYRLRVESAGERTETAIISDGVAVPDVLGAVQVDFSLGSDAPQPQELLVTVGVNSSGYNLGVFFRDDLGCVARFRAADDSELVIPIHGSVGSASGLACEGAAGSQFLVRTEATASAGSGEYDTVDTRLERDGERLVDGTSITGFIVDDGTADSPLLRYTGVTGCGF